MGARVAGWAIWGAGVLGWGEMVVGCGEWPQCVCCVSGCCCIMFVVWFCGGVCVGSGASRSFEFRCASCSLWRVVVGTTVVVG